MEDADFITHKQLFAEVAGVYPSYTQFLERLREAYARHLARLPLFNETRLLEIGRERGWIKSDQERIVVAVPDVELS